MPSLVPITSFSNKYSPNLIPSYSVFNDDTILNVTSGVGVLQLSVNDAYRGNYATILNQNYKTNDLHFNFGDSLKTPIAKNGLYSFQMTIFRTGVIIPNISIGLEIYQDGIYTGTINGVYNQSNIYSQVGNSVTFSQTIDCLGIFELDFAFVVYKDASASDTNLGFNIGNFKIEYDTENATFPTPYSLPIDYYSTTEDLHVSETQWSVTDVGTQLVANGGSLNLFTLINNATNKDLVNSDTYDQLDIVTNAIKTTYRGAKIIHTIRVSFNITVGTDQFYQLQIRRAIDDSVVYRSQLQRNADETIQTIEMTTRTLSETDPFVLDGFYIAFVNNSGAIATIDDGLTVLVINNYQKSQQQ